MGRVYVERLVEKRAIPFVQDTRELVQGTHLVLEVGRHSSRHPAGIRSRTKSQAIFCHQSVRCE